jgi:PAS domain S-box-containing protein
LELEIPSATELQRATREPGLSLDETIFDLLPAGVCVCDASGTVVRYNHKAAAMWGRCPAPGDRAEKFGGAACLIGPGGSPLPRTEWPVARALNIGRPVRGQEILIERPDGTRIWALADADVLRDASGQITGAADCFLDITLRKRAEQREQEHQALLRAVFDLCPECMKIVAADGTVREMNPAGLRLLGAATAEMVCGSRVFDFIAPNDRDEWRSYHDRVCGGEHLSWRFDIIGLNGIRRHMESYAAPIHLPDGTVAQLAIARDITQQRRDQQNLEEGKRHLQDLLNALPAAIYTTDAAGRVTYYNDAAALLAGRHPVIDQDEWCVTWRLSHPDGRPMRHDECPMAIALKEGRELRDQEAVAERPDGTRVPFLAYPTPLHDSSGIVVGAVNMLVDVSARKQSEERQQLLINELNHRVRNTLVTVQSIAAHSFRHESASPARAWFESRLMALSRAHDILMRESWEGAALHDVVQQAVAPLGDRERIRFQIDGPALRVRAGVALALAMALHELCTNAAKYGALRGPSGRVAIGWEVQPGDGGRLRLRWVESDGPPVGAPRRKGFGSRLIERGLARELGGAVSLSFEPKGVVCEIEVPFS